MPVLETVSRQRHLINVKDGYDVVAVEVSVEAVVQFNQLCWPKLAAQLRVEVVVHGVDIGLLAWQRQIAPVDEVLKGD